MPAKPTKTPKRRPSQLMAVSEIMLTATEPLTLAEIASKASRLTGRSVSEASVSARLRDLRKPSVAGLTIVLTREGSVCLYEAVVPRANDEVGTPQVQANTLPRNPIVYGKPRSNVAPQVEGTQSVAGSRSALAFAETLRQ